MVNDGRDETCTLPAEVDFLMFSAAGVRMAVDASQVDGIMSPGQAGEGGIAVRVLSEILGAEQAASPASQKILLYRDGGEACGIGVDSLDSIVPVPTGTIRLFTEPLLSQAGLRPFWGAVPQGKNVVLLIDLYRLKGLKSCKAGATA